MNQNYIVKIERLYKGFASIRENIIAECIKRKQNLIIEWNGNYMGIPLNHLLRPLLFQIHTREFESKFNSGQKYTLFDFYFVKDKNLKYTK
jgi:hypothetical protein